MNRSIFTLIFLFIFFYGANHAETFSSQNNGSILYKYNLVNAGTYSDDSGFLESTPVRWLWDGSAAQGVNDSKATGNTEAWIEFDFGAEEEIAEAKLYQDNGGNRVTDWKVMYWTNEGWKDVFPYVVSNTSGWQKQTFDIKATKVRFYAKCTSNGYVSIHEIELYTKLSPIKKKNVIGCVGDSNTYSDGGSGQRDVYSWPAQLNKILGNEYQVRNFGVSGSTLMKAPANSPWTNTSQYTIHKDLYSNISIIALGTNDSKSVNWNSTQFKNDYIDLIKEFQAYPSKPEVYILIPIKAFSTNHSISNDVISKQIRPILRDISKNYGIAVIDGYTATENIGDLVPDGIHPNAEGLTIIAEKIASILTTSKPIISVNSKPSSVTYAEYCWYKDGVLIADASESTYTAVEAGSYKVAVKLNSTTDDIVVSDSFEVTEPDVQLVISDEQAAGISPTPQTSAIKVSDFPNGLLIENAAGSNFQLFDIHGKLLKNNKIQNNSEKIDIADLSGGVYLYKLGEVKGKILK